MHHNNQNRRHGGGGHGGGGHHGGGGGRSQHGNNQGGRAPGPRMAFPICRFHTIAVRENPCRFSESQCRGSHAITIVADFQAHQSAIKSMAVVGEGAQLLTGSTDKSIKVWNLAQLNGTTPATTISTPGAVQNIQVNNNTVYFANDEVILPPPPADEAAAAATAAGQNGAAAPAVPFVNTVPAGVIRAVNPQDGSLVPVLRGADMPYTHPQPINSFVVVAGPGNMPVVVSGGAEGMIRVWSVNPASSKFEQAGALEGHLRGVLVLVLHEGHLWSGSLDGTIRVWDMNASRCIGALTADRNGHTGAVSCLVDVPVAGGGYIASGGMDGAVILWRYSGEMAWKGSYDAGVTSHMVFQDKHGGQQLLFSGLVDGRIMCRSLVTMNIMFRFDATTLVPEKVHAKAVWSMVNLGNSSFATSDHTGRVLVWKVSSAITEPPQQQQ